MWPDLPIERSDFQTLLETMLNCLSRREGDTVDFTGLLQEAIEYEGPRRVPGKTRELVSDWLEVLWSNAPDDYDDEIEEEEGPEMPESYTYHDYFLHTQEDGSIVGYSTTNDNDDDGRPDFNEATWDVRYKDYETMLAMTGGSHTGWNGVKVHVFLDGDEVFKPKEEKEEDHE